MTFLVTQFYQERLATRNLLPDPAQLPVLEKLDALAAVLARPRRWWRSLFAPRGLYIHGAVGRGKSMLMDLFFQAAPVQKKRRVHFNAFMLDVHRRLHEARQSGQEDALLPVAAQIAAESRLLCFDEFQVNDIADAMILSRLFTALLDRGVVVVATSNAAPGELYRNGLQRQLFLPFIALLRQEMDIVEIGAGVDHRQERLAGQKLYFTPDDADAVHAIDAIFAALTENDTPQAETIEVAGRRLIVPTTANRVARFSFDDLCRQPLGAADYLAIATRFGVIIVEHIPVFEPAYRNEALRFITLIDQLYDRRIRLIASAEARISLLYPENGVLAFEFQRTTSRLTEMQSHDYV